MGSLTLDIAAICVLVVGGVLYARKELCDWRVAAIFFGAGTGVMAVSAFTAWIFGTAEYFPEALQLGSKKSEFRYIPLGYVSLILACVSALCRLLKAARRLRQRK